MWFLFLSSSLLPTSNIWSQLFFSIERFITNHCFSHWFFCVNQIYLHIRRPLGCMWHKSMWTIFEVILQLPFPNFHPFTAILTNDSYLPPCCFMFRDAEPYEFLLLDHLADWFLVGFSNGKCCQIGMKASRKREKRHLFISFICSLNSDYIPLPTAPTRLGSPFFTVLPRTALSILFLPLFL